MVGGGRGRRRDAGADIGLEAEVDGGQALETDALEGDVVFEVGEFANDVHLGLGRIELREIDGVVEHPVVVAHADGVGAQPAQERVLAAVAAQFVVAVGTDQHVAVGGPADVFDVDQGVRAAFAVERRAGGDGAVGRGRDGIIVGRQVDRGAARVITHRILAAAAVDEIVAALHAEFFVVGAARDPVVVFGPAHPVDAAEGVEADARRVPGMD